MAASELVLKEISRAGLDLTAGLATWNNDGMYFQNGYGKRTFLAVANAGASPVTLTATIQQKVDGQTPTAKSLVAAAGKTTLFGPFSQEEYNDASGYVQLPAAMLSSVTGAAVWLPWE